MDKKIIQIKDEHWDAFKTSFKAYEFFWHPISLHQFNKVKRLYPYADEQREKICEMAVFRVLKDGEEIDHFDYSENIYGYLPLRLAEDILQKSGFGKINTGMVSGLIDEYTSEMDQFRNQVPCYIVEAFPSLDIEDVEKMPTKKMMWYFSRARFMLKKFKGFVSEEEEQQPKGVTPKTAKQGIGLNSGTYGDFPEARRMKRFMDGDLK